MTAANHDLPPAPNCVTPDEKLGRRVFSGKQIRGERADYRAFLERPGVRALSVDRLTHSPTDFAVAKADEAAVERPSSTFYGWGVVLAEQAVANRNRVQASPSPDGANPYHADIIFPEFAIANLEAQKNHAQTLAAVSRWRARPASG